MIQRVRDWPTVRDRRSTVQLAEDMRLPQRYAITPAVCDCPSGMRLPDGCAMAPSWRDDSMVARSPCGVSDFPTVE
ncbi:MAG: hypothetical protein RLY70_4702 [Planctomycetota bacterium]|jgi:hypothetical protein